MATITLKAGMVWKGAYDASEPYDKLDVVYNADKTQIAVCKQGGTGIPLTNSNYWEVSIDASGIIALLEDALAHGEIYTMKIGSVTTGATSSATIVNNHQTHETILNLVLEKGEKGDKGDKGDRGEKGDTTVIDPSTATAYTLYNQTGNHTDGAMTQDAVTKEFEKLDETYARNDGYYESMGVGTATNLKGQNIVDAEFTYRKSGGNVEVQDGNAMVEAIKGNTIAWNQCSTTRYERYSDAVNNITISVDGTKCTVTDTNYNGSGGDAVMIVNIVNKAIVGHKYIVLVHSGIIQGEGLNNPAFEGVTSMTDLLRLRGDVWYGMFAATYPITNLYLKYVGTKTIGDSWYFDKPMLFDLTLIYGSGNEPATVEQFEQDYFNWFGKPLTYEPYDAGSLRNTKVSALKTTGFNQWDEEWELGTINTTTGQNIVSSNNIRSKDYIPVIADSDYYCRFTKPTGGIWCLAYDTDKNLIATPNMSSIVVNNACLVSTVVFHTPINASYIRFYTTDTYGTTYNHDICINISDPNRNGEYEPYKESTLPLDVTTLTGKLNGEGSSVVVFADGMNSAGNVHDEIKIENGVVKAIRRVGSVDLGNKEWLRLDAGSNWSFYLSWSLIQRGTASKNYTNSKYLIGNVGASEISTGGNDKTLRSYSDGIYIKDTSYSYADTFRAANQGVMLYYELAEPEVYVLDDFSLPKLYPVANGGTEEQLSNSPNSLPATLSIRYGLNAAAFIQNAPKNYISKESMTNFLSNLGSAMGGTWTMTWNSSTNKYDFSFTQNRSTDVEPIEDK